MLYQNRQVVLTDFAIFEPVFVKHNRSVERPKSLAKIAAPVFALPKPICEIDLRLVGQREDKGEPRGRYDIIRGSERRAVSASKAPAAGIGRNLDRPTACRTSRRIVKLRLVENK